MWKAGDDCISLLECLYFKGAAQPAESPFWVGKWIPRQQQPPDQHSSVSWVQGSRRKLVQTFFIRSERRLSARGWWPLVLVGGIESVAQWLLEASVSPLRVVHHLQVQESCRNLLSYASHLVDKFIIFQMQPHNPGSTASCPQRPLKRMCTDLILWY